MTLRTMQILAIYAYSITDLWLIDVCMSDAHKTVNNKLQIYILAIVS